MADEVIAQAAPVAPPPPFTMSDDHLRTLAQYVAREILNVEVPVPKAPPVAETVSPTQQFVQPQPRKRFVPRTTQHGWGYPRSR